MEKKVRYNIQWSKRRIDKSLDFRGHNKGALSVKLSRDDISSVVIEQTFVTLGHGFKKGSR